MKSFNHSHITSALKAGANSTFVDSHGDLVVQLDDCTDVICRFSDDQVHAWLLINKTSPHHIYSPCKRGLGGFEPKRFFKSVSQACRFAIDYPH